MSDFEMPYFADDKGNRGFFTDPTARGWINVIEGGQKDVWFPDVYDYTTKIKTLTANECHTYIKKVGDMTIAWLYTGDGRELGSFSTMAQLRNFPNNTKWCLGGMVYNGAIENSPRTIQASNVGVYFRPNLTGSFGAGVLSMVLFFLDITL